MSRSGYSDDCDDNWALIRWRGAVASAIRGKRGQAFLRELLSAMDAMPQKQLISNSFTVDGAHCTLGAVGSARGVDMPQIDPDANMWGFDPCEIREQAAAALQIPDSLAAEIMFLNDEGGWHTETPEGRWKRMREWVAAQISEPPAHE